MSPISTEVLNISTLKKSDFGGGGGSGQSNLCEECVFLVEIAQPLMQRECMHIQYYLIWKIVEVYLGFSLLQSEVFASTLEVYKKTKIFFIY